MQPNRTVALVGKPNVGKSRLFNRLVGRRVSIVHDQPGVTRDVISEELPDFTLLDTGGIGLGGELTPEIIQAATEDQADFAIAAADLILLVTDGREGCSPLDETVASLLRSKGKPIQLVVNKIDQPELEGAIDDFARLGLGVGLPVSAEHDRGTDALQTAILRHLGPPPPVDLEKVSQRRIRISFAGRPNVGKSSLCNRLLASDRMIVSDVPGTTRESVERDLDYESKGEGTWGFRLVDTAGMRRKRKVDSTLEYFSNLRTKGAIESSDAVFLVIDAQDGVTKQDQILAESILDEGRALAILVNKWDQAQDTFRGGALEGYANLKEFRDSYEESIRKELFFLPDSPVVFVSAQTGFAIERILRTARQLDAIQETPLPTGELNRVIGGLLERQPPTLIRGKRFKVYYTVQVGTRPFRIRLFCNQPHRFEKGYKRYMEKGFQSHFGLPGCPVRFLLTGKEERYSRED
ncbi:MAG: ribosome biogenesis GTPase Der [Opitutae bacterium]